MKIQPTNKHHASHGLTLLEMMIVVAIMGVAAMILIPNMRRRMSYYRVADAADRLYMELRLARGHAISGTRKVSVSLDTTANKLTSSSDLDDSGTIDAGETSVLTLADTDTVTVQINANTGQFFSDGTFTCSNIFWKVLLTASDSSKKYVYVFPGGHVEVSGRSLE